MRADEPVATSHKLVGMRVLRGEELNVLKIGDAVETGAGLEASGSGSEARDAGGISRDGAVFIKEVLVIACTAERADVDAVAGELTR